MHSETLGKLERAVLKGATPLRWLGHTQGPVAAATMGSVDVCEMNIIRRTC